MSNPLYAIYKTRDFLPARVLRTLYLFMYIVTKRARHLNFVYLEPDSTLLREVYCQ